MQAFWLFYAAWQLRFVVYWNFTVRARHATMAIIKRSVPSLVPSRTLSFLCFTCPPFFLSFSFFFLSFSSFFVLSFTFFLCQPNPFWMVMHSLLSLHFLYFWFVIFFFLFFLFCVCMDSVCIYYFIRSFLAFSLFEFFLRSFVFLFDP